MLIDHTSTKSTSIGDAFDQLLARTIEASGEVPSESIVAMTRVFFFCGANIAMSMCFSRPMTPQERQAIVTGIIDEFNEMNQMLTPREDASDITRH